MLNKRFQDSGKVISDFMNKILVVCPVCHKCAYGFIHPTKIICHKCGFNKTYDRYSYGRGTFCGEDLWLMADCCSEKLWAYNKEHLDFIEQFVSAKVRERKPNINQSVVSRLPQWMKKNNNRESILKSISTLKEKLETV